MSELHINNMEDHQSQRGIILRISPKTRIEIYNTSKKAHSNSPDGGYNGTLYFDENGHLHPDSHIEPSSKDVIQKEMEE